MVFRPVIPQKSLTAYGNGFLAYFGCICTNMEIIHRRSIKQTLMFLNEMGTIICTCERILIACVLQDAAAWRFDITFLRALVGKECVHYSLAQKVVRIIIRTIVVGNHTAIPLDIFVDVMTAERVRNALLESRLWGRGYREH